MSSVEVKSFANADEINDNFNNAKIEAVNVGGQRIMKLSLEPGWKWSNDIKPTVGDRELPGNTFGSDCEWNSCSQAQRWH